MKLFILLMFTLIGIVHAQKQPLGGKLSNVLTKIDRFYVDSADIDQLVERAIVDMLHELDPHSVYVSKKNVKALNQPLIGSFEGIGIYFNILNDTLIVISPIAGGPSQKAGIMPGDKIVAVDTISLTGAKVTTKTIKDKLMGKKGTEAVLSVIRRNALPLEIRVVRDKIPIFSIDAAYMLSPKTGYIKLNRFSGSSLNEFTAALKKLEALGMKDLMLDLRANGGGYLNTAIDMADEFLDESKLIVYTEGEHSIRRDYMASTGNNFEKGRLAILIDEGSASASEILAGAVQDWDRGIIVGRRSFGKGLVQRPFYLGDGSMIRLTIARYYTPTGRSIQKSYEKGYKAYRLDLVERFQNGELLSSDSIHFPDSLQHLTLKNKRKVYGGGGIMPDVFIPLDTLQFSDEYMNLIRKGYVNRFVLDYIDKNRSEITVKYPTFLDFDTQFSTNELLLEQLRTYVEKHSEKKTDSLFMGKEYVQLQNTKLHIKALIAGDLWGYNEYYIINNQYDSIVLKAKAILENRKAYKKILTSVR